MRVVYVDELFLINLIINYVLLIVTAKICAAGVSRLRLFGAAAFGAAYAVAAVLPLPDFVSGLPMKLAVGVAIALIAFGGQKRLLRHILIFFAVTAAFGGVVMAASLIGGGGQVLLPTSAGLRILLPCFVVCYGVLTVVFRRAAKNRGKGGVVTLRLRAGGRETSLRALQDTGNALVDPLSGRGVIVAGVHDVRELFDLPIRKTVEELRRTDAVRVLETLGKTGNGARFQLVPYSAVGVAGGMLLAFRPDEVEIDGKKSAGMLLALSPNSVSDSGSYSALLGA